MMPVGIFSVTTVSLRFSAGVIGTVLNISLIIVLCFLSTGYGLLCGIHYRRLDWENEIEVVKQGTALVLYLFPNMMLTMAFIVGVTSLGRKINPAVIQFILIPVILLIAFVCWKKAIEAAERPVG